MKAEEKLQQKMEVNPVTQCWEWTGALDVSGYGQLGTHSRKYNSKRIRAHRLAYETWVGPIPPGMFVCHHCDNRKCINPTHLFVGTNLDNIADKVAKGRQCRGTSHPNARLTEQDVIALRLGTITPAQLAERLGIKDASTLYRARNGTFWKHIHVDITERIDDQVESC